MMNACPVCGEPADTFDEEIAHMQERHPEVIEQRMIDAGFFKDPVTGEWVDKGWPVTRIRRRNA